MPWEECALPVVSHALIHRRLFPTDHKVNISRLRYVNVLELIPSRLGSFDAKLGGRFHQAESGINVVRPLSRGQVLPSGKAFRN